ncbi:large conductance mechanosensitive channel protein MscL [Mucilaginibacter sp. L3T2-6]|uniref:large conductance mechanosensitive channel protein MscL n=1 Tax=Mucilaginibacter sp. L3T2-6 TaxID=3062491 RepID=UPI00267634F0|nr:large conductance mechanosensitive channel protein MscL [Mucilaginibacter sp. L3T2-6]MDO3640897.1 large conductance mechanosensitive channel protein MscL [Mucilaginibacter sp. L3T2-6]MDV6213627.1 large conductance mechanosensitive channel protein MscL [Mucilaginibacter sp. L3T2-6]
MAIVKEFRDFAMRGNVVDLAVGVIIGAAFGKIVDSVVNDLIMPVVGIAFKADFSNLYVPLSSKVPEGLALADARKLGPVFAWGNFVTVVLNFVILAFIVFLLVKGINSLKKKEEAAPAAPAAPSKEEVLLTEIRDLLAAGKR